VSLRVLHEDYICRKDYKFDSCAKYEAIIILFSSLENENTFLLQNLLKFTIR